MTLEMQVSVQKIFRRTLFLFLCALLVFFLMGAAASWVLTQGTHLPLEHLPSEANLKYETIQFDARVDHFKIAGWWIPADLGSSKKGFAPVIIVVHGRGQNRSRLFKNHTVDFLKAMHDAGFSLLALDLRGHGESEGNRVSFGILEKRDVEGALDWILAHHKVGSASSVGLLGTSLGAATVLAAASDESNFRATVADASYADLKPLIFLHWKEEAHIPEFFISPTLLATRLIFGYDLLAARPIDDIVHIGDRAVLLIHGKSDRYIPPENSMELLKRDPHATLWLVDDAKHSRSYETEPVEYIKRVSAFFRKNLSR